MITGFFCETFVFHFSVNCRTRRVRGTRQGQNVLGTAKAENNEETKDYDDDATFCNPGTTYYFFFFF